MGKRILLVEGKDDQHVMWNLLEVRDVPGVFNVERTGEEPPDQDDGGVDKLIEAIPRWLLESDLERLAVVLDANDKGPTARWTAIRNRLTRRGYGDIPSSLEENGVVFDLSLEPTTPRAVRFAAWIMPNNRSVGMLEDFVICLIREDDSMLPFVDRFLDSIPVKQRRFSQSHHSKARIHSWLAVSERPGRPMGQALKADRQFDPGHPSVELFLKWMRAALVD
jgi:hypothetical protein